MARLEDAGYRRACTEPYGWGSDRLGSASQPPHSPVVLGRIGGSGSRQGPEPPRSVRCCRPSGLHRLAEFSCGGGPRGVSRFLLSIYKDRWICRWLFRTSTEQTRALHGLDMADGVDQSKFLLNFCRAHDRDDAIAGVSPVGELTEGINVTGYFRAELGVGRRHAV